MVSIEHTPLEGHRMADLNLEAEYNNRRRVPEHPQIGTRWQAASADYRRTARADLDQPYGKGERQRHDLFYAGPAKAPLVVYIHGGYWQRGERQDNSFVARALNEAGVDVALPSYSLCPSVSVMQIVEELRLCLAVLWSKTKKHPVVTGHSAGGHLTAAMLATDWSRFAGVPADLVRSGCAISGIFDLAPLIPTSINDLAGLDAKTAALASPLLWSAPPKDRTLVAAVGGDESSEFHRQARLVADTWARAGVKTEYLSVPATNHFTIVDELTKPGSPLMSRVLALAR
jgi:arylformamidase